MEITIDQLEHLLNQQRSNCIGILETEWRKSEYRANIVANTPDDFRIEQWHEVRDSIHSASYPDDFLILKKYKTK